MGFIGILIQLTLVAVVLFELTAAAVAFPIALPDCPDRCGVVEIPYPFGLREGCYIDRNFYVNCTTNSFGKTQPVIPEGFNITNISLQGQIDMSMYVAHDCYVQGVSKTWNIPWLNSPLNFTVSSNQNKFVVVGCDTYGDLYGYQQNGEYISTGCTSECQSTKYIDKSSCSGVGCCEVDIPKGLRNISINLNTINNYTKVESFNPCGHAFISKQGTYSFSIDSLLTLREIEVMPMVLDWAIGNETCNDVTNKSSYMCGGHSTCIDSDIGSGYRCKCMDGYSGNPYLRHGCQGNNLCIYYLPSPI